MNFNFSKLAPVFAVVSAFHFSSFSAQANETAEIFSYGDTVTCETSEFYFTMTPRAPWMGESVTIYRVGNQAFVQSKVNIEVVNKITKRQIDSFHVEDATDPWESANPIFGGKEFSFSTDRSGKPGRLVYKGKDLTSVTDCDLSDDPR